jgi:hypothetical protein
MNEPREKHRASFRALCAAVLYLLGLGPALYLLQLGEIGDSVPQWVEVPCFFLYLPIFWLHDHGPKAAHDLLEWYANVWHP